MTNAYNELFLDDAMDTLGGAVEYAVLQCGLSGQEFLDLFVISGIAQEFGKGNVLYVSGKSGIELAQDIFNLCGKKIPENDEIQNINYPPEYWIGWILAYYQWSCGMTFKAILKVLTYDMLYDMYGVFHEADPEKAVRKFNDIMEARKETNLARIRKMRGFSQSELAKAAGVSIRFIQLHEQKKQNIRNAQYNLLSSIAEVLNCDVDELMDE